MFHGTSSAIIDKITAEGFKIGGQDGIPILTGAVYGQGVYVSEDPAFAMRYIKDGQKRLLFAKCCPSTDTFRAMAGGMRMNDQLEIKFFDCTSHDFFFVWFASDVIQQLVLRKKEQALPFYVVHLQERGASSAHPVPGSAVSRFLSSLPAMPSLPAVPSLPSLSSFFSGSSGLLPLPGTAAGAPSAAPAVSKKKRRTRNQA